jgi:hypothetical protein
MAGFLRWCIAAAVGGLIGASVWAGITYFTGYEIGWIAWGVGFVVGLAVRIGAGEANGVGPGVVAVIGAVAALLAGKYAAVHLLVGNELAAGSAVTISAENMQMGMAYEVVEEMEGQGKKLSWPPGQSVEIVEMPTHFPSEVWAEAQKRWNAFPPEEQAQQIAARQEMMAALTGELQGMIVDEGFKGSFSPIALLFFGLAIFTAFRLGSGLSSE